jgi:hypothetical protein
MEEIMKSRRRTEEHNGVSKIYICTALHCNTLHCTVLYCVFTALYCTALHGKRSAPASRRNRTPIVARWSNRTLIIATAMHSIKVGKFSTYEQVNLLTF